MSRPWSYLSGLVVISLDIVLGGLVLSHLVMEWNGILIFQSAPCRQLLLDTKLVHNEFDQPMYPQIQYIAWSLDGPI